MKHSTKLMNHLLDTLFNRSTEKGMTYYRPKPGKEAEARSTWANHGVCMKCFTREITAGRCIQCGWTP